MCTVGGLFRPRYTPLSVLRKPAVKKTSPRETLRKPGLSVNFAKKIMSSSICTLGRDYLKRSVAVARGNWPQFSRVKFDLTRPAERKISEGAAQRRRRGARAQRRTRKSAHVLPGREGVRGKRAVGKGLQAVTFIASGAANGHTCLVQPY